MSYIGASPIVGNFQVCDAISVVNGQAAYTMQVGSANVFPESANHMLVSLNGILQKPNGSFTISGSTITFASNLVTGDVIDFIQLLGDVLDIGTPSDATVTNAKTSFVSTSSAAGLQIKGDGTTDGTLQLNCSQNSHGIKLASPAHSAGQSYTVKFPTGNITADKFLKVASISGSGTSAVGQLSFADAGGGKILQVVSVADTTARSTTSTSFNTMSSALTLNITPSASSSKILVMLSTGFYLTANDGATTIYRDSTNLGHAQYGLFYMHVNGAFGMATINYMDSPSSTSQLTYAMYARNISGSSTLNMGAENGRGSLIAMEIGA